MGLKILFITRNYPPKVGGLEAYSYQIIKAFSKENNVHKIVLTKANYHIAWFLPYCLLKGVLTSWIHSKEFIHLCDGVLAPIGVCLKILTKSKVSITIHGLDITYRNPLYQKMIPWCIGRLDKIICVSRSTLEECRNRSIATDKCIVIPNGIRPDETYMRLPRAELRLRIEKLVGCPLRDRVILLTVGRLVRRKGVAWFLENVMPRLAFPYLYLIAGEGPDDETIRSTLVKKGLSDRVLLLGTISNEVRNLLYNGSDVFIMPNVVVPGDVEGFGMVVIEAGSCGLPVVASHIQGIKDAVLDGETGYLVPERDGDAFIAKIRGMKLEREKVRFAVNRKFNWERIYEQYRRELMEAGRKREMGKGGEALS